MVFSSSLFLFFFLPVLLLAYYLIRAQLRNFVLLLASILFYTWGELEYVLLLIASITFNFLAGLLLTRLSLGGSNHGKKITIAVAVALNLAVLIYYKYAGFIFEVWSDNIKSLSGGFIDVKNVILPLGISFYTFQSISYIVDVYRKPIEVQRNYINCALYIAFFPQLIAGPIVRYNEIRAQLSDRVHSIERFRSGVELFAIGLFKKLVIANTVSKVAILAFDKSYEDTGCLLAWLGLVCYSIQIYYDFSGYTDMARGLGRFFGFDLPVNFRVPYSSKSIQEFWRRWHITLSTWFRDYLYIPLGGSRISNSRTIVNLWIVFILCGLWHGASWNFVIWGAIHGLFLSLERFRFSNFLEAVPRFISNVYVLLVVMISWVFFRADNLGNAIIYLKSLFSLELGNVPIEVLAIMDTRWILITVIGLLFSVGRFDHVLERLELRLSNSIIKDSYLHVTRFAIVSGLLLVSIAQLAVEKHNPFIYFRF